MHCLCILFIHLVFCLPSLLAFSCSCYPYILCMHNIYPFSLTERFLTFLIFLQQTVGQLGRDYIPHCLLSVIRALFQRYQWLGRTYVRVCVYRSLWGWLRYFQWWLVFILVHHSPPMTNRTTLETVNMFKACGTISIKKAHTKEHWGEQMLKLFGKNNETATL